MIRRAEFLPFGLPKLGAEEIAAVQKVLESGWLTTGLRCKEFEAAVAEWTGAQHAVAVNSCTAALHTSLVALLDVEGPGVEEGDEVITSPLTFASTANVILHTGARPVFADIELETGNIALDDMERAITPRTRAVIPVHFAGQPCDMDEIERIASSRGFEVVEDAAHAVGATYKDRRIGSKSKAVCFSFYPTKNITTGEGGMILTDSEELAQRYRMVALHGMSKDAWKRFTDKGSWFYEIRYPGFKYNMTDIQAALGIHQMSRLEEFIGVRARYARRYSEAFRELKGAILPHVKSDRESAWHLYVLRLGPGAKLDRDELIGRLKEDFNIGTTVNFIPLPMHPYYRDTLGCRIDDYPNAKRFYQECVSLPLYPKMTDDDVEYVVSAVQTLLG